VQLRPSCTAAAAAATPPDLTPEAQKNDSKAPGHITKKSTRVSHSTLDIACTAGGKTAAAVNVRAVHSSRQRRLLLSRPLRDHSRQLTLAAAVTSALLALCMQPAFADCAVPHDHCRCPHLVSRQTHIMPVPVIA
jgi:hypothetical protein